MHIIPGRPIPPNMPGIKAAIIHPSPKNITLSLFFHDHEIRVIAPNIKANEALVSPAEPPTFNEQHELRQIKALDAILENRFANAYPIPKAVRYPRSNPTHYDDVVKEMEEAPTRSWAASLGKRLKGAFRLS